MVFDSFVMTSSPNVRTLSVDGQIDALLQPHWAMTVHKSQGSQFRHVFIGPDLDHVPGPKSLTRNLWYTAFTRAQQAVHVIRDPEVKL